MKNKTIKYIILICFAILLISIIINRRQKNGDTLNYEQKVEYTKKWLWGIKDNNEKTAIITASKLIEKDKTSKTISPSYIEIFQKNKLAPAFLSGNFNFFDYQLWRDAVFFKVVSNTAINNIDAGKRDEDSAQINALFNLVHHRIKKGDPPRGTIIWPVAVWQAKKGLCDRQAWLLCELAYQAGYETQLIYLRDPTTLISPHTICEIRKGTQKWLADPFSGILLEDKSLSDLDSDNELKTQIWPNNKRWQAAVHNAIYWTPSYPQDYCKRNQLLHKALFYVLHKDTPRFGEDPDLRRKKFINLVEDIDRSKFQYQLWFTPIRLLAIQKQIQEESDKENR